MRVRDVLLALLTCDPAHGYQLKLEYERVTRSGPVNIGQIYQTLDRLERDGLVEREPVASGERRITYHVTDDGRTSAHTLLLDSDSQAAVPGSAAVTKVLLAIEMPGVDPVAVLDTQRAALLQGVQEARRESRGKDVGLIERLALEAELAVVDAELRWLDLCEEELKAGGR